MRSFIVLLLFALVVGCGGHDLRLNQGVPKPRTTVPYGMIAFAVETGPTRNAKLRIKRMSFFTRETALPRQGVMWFKLPAGDWRIDVIGDVVKPRVVSMSGYEEGSPAEGKVATWPPKPLVVSVKKNHLTNLGRICAHLGCQSPWQSSELPGLGPWKRLDRLITYAPTKESKDKEGEKKSPSSSAPGSSAIEKKAETPASASGEKGHKE